MIGYVKGEKVRQMKESNNQLNGLKEEEEGCKEGFPHNIVINQI